METNEDKNLNSVIKNIIDVSSNIKELIGSNELCDKSKEECKKSLDQGLDLLIKVENDLEEKVIYKSPELKVTTTRLNQN